ncbi:hypothetical protein Tco_1487820, partial [Tanacetum coccineum]
FKTKAKLAPVKYSVREFIPAVVDEKGNWLSFKELLGFETIGYYPFIMMAMDIWSESGYIARTRMRYKIDGVKYISDLNEILSTAAAADGVPYHLSVFALRARQPRGLKSRHAVLIVNRS